MSGRGGGDHVAPPSVDWLNTIGLRAPTGVAVVSNRVQVR